MAPVLVVLALILNFAIENVIKSLILNLSFLAVVSCAYGKAAYLMHRTPGQKGLNASLIIKYIRIV